MNFSYDMLIQANDRIGSPEIWTFQHDRWLTGGTCCFGLGPAPQNVGLNFHENLKGVLRSFFILDILNVLIPESTLFFTRTQTEQICLRYPHPPVTSPENGFGDIRRSVEKPLQCLQLLRHKRLTNVLQCTVINPRNQTTARTTRV